MMATITSGVYPVFNNKFKIGTNGIASEESEMKTIAELESFSVSIDTNVEEWTSMTEEGWVSRLATGKGFSISLKGKRCVGDEGNDYVAGLMFKTGTDLSTIFEWELPSGTKVSFKCVVNISSAGGDSTNVEGLEFEVMSSGKPTVSVGV